MDYFRCNLQVLSTNINMMKLLLVLFLCFACSHSAKILGVFYMPSYSHFAPGQTLMNALVEQGHEVSVIAAYNDKASKFKTIQLTGFHERMDEIKKDMNMFVTPFSKNFMVSIIFFHMMGADFVDWTLEHPNVQALLKSDEKFDVIIFEQFVNEAFHGFCHHYNASCVIYSAMASNYILNPLVRNPEDPSYTAQMYLSGERPMNFLTRVQNTLMLAYQSFLFHVMFIPQQNRIMHKFFPNSPALRDLLYETDLILLNSHLSYTDVVPHVPSMVEIGGFHIKPAGKLPEEFQKYLDQAKEGVVYFSMGSVLAGKDIPEEKRKMLINAFSKLKLKVLWKFEEDLQGLPSNVKIQKWVPQKEVLAHPNVKLFITHGGLSSTIESIYFGVPVVGIPIFGDQEANMKKCETFGIGVTVDFWNLKEDDVLNAINAVLNNKKYSETAKKMSQLINDRPLKPLDTAVYWIEHIIRHNGGKHLRSGALDLYWYQYMLLDVTIFLAAVVVVFFCMTSFCLRKLCCRKKSAKLDTSVKVTKDKKKK